MASYLCGPSVLRLTGHTEAVQPGASFDHDFSVTGPEGEHGPAREAALIASGAASLASATKTASPPDDKTTTERPARREKESS